MRRTLGPKFVYSVNDVSIFLFDFDKITYCEFLGGEGGILCYILFLSVSLLSSPILMGEIFDSVVHLLGFVMALE